MSECAQIKNMGPIIPERVLFESAKQQRLQ